MKGPSAKEQLIQQLRSESQKERLDNIAKRLVVPYKNETRKTKIDFVHNSQVGQPKTSMKHNLASKPRLTQPPRCTGLTSRLSTRRLALINFIIGMAAKVECGRPPTPREDLLRCLTEVSDLCRDSDLWARVAPLVQRIQGLMASIAESQLHAKEQLLALKEQNLGLRQKVWEKETQKTDPLETINARLRLEEMVKCKDEEILGLKETNDVASAD